MPDPQIEFTLHFDNRSYTIRSPLPETASIAEGGMSLASGLERLILDMLLSVCQSAYRWESAGGNGR